MKVFTVAALAVASHALISGEVDKVALVAPKLAKLMKRAESEPEILAQELRNSPMAQIAPEVGKSTPKAPKADALPVVITHGMGDSCFNGGMKIVTQAAGQHVGAYSVCIPTGSSRIKDTINGFLLSMDDSVEVFAKAVKADPKLANGFNAFGLSQGNNVIRGYMTKYNNPPVKTFMSICGINAGVGAFPQCSPDTPVIGEVCKGLTEVLGEGAYLEFFQNHLFQADYFRAPEKVGKAEYLKNSELAAWNGESDSFKPEWKDNWAKTDRFVWVKGTEDTVVWPREGEWWGAMDPSDPWKKILPMNQTEWYVNDTFGLRTADEAGKNHFESFKGQHIQFTLQELNLWLDMYFK